MADPRHLAAADVLWCCGSSERLYNSARRSGGGQASTQGLGVRQPLPASRRSRRLMLASLWDPLSPRSWSGIPYSMVSGFRQNGAEVVPVGPFRHPFRFPVKAASRVRNAVLRSTYNSDWEPWVARAYARQLEMALAQENPDVLIATGSIPISRVDTPVPIVLWIDATVGCASGYYSFLTGVSRRTQRNAAETEAGAMERCSRVVAASPWAAQAVATEYSMSPDRVYCVPFGANIVPTAWAGARDHVGPRLLFVGVDWFRKGADIAVETTRLMRLAGINATIDIVGCDPPAGYSLPPFVTLHGFVDPSTPAGRETLDRLFRGAALFLLPTRAEMFGIVFCEAAAYGLPSLGPATGGVASALRDGVSGILCSEHARAEEYAREATQLLEDHSRYLRMAESARSVYETELNWFAACGRILDIVDHIHGMPTHPGRQHFTTS